MYYGSDEFNNAIENTQGNALKTRLKFSDEEIIELISSMRYYGGSNDTDDLSIGNIAMAYVEVSAFTNKMLTGREFLLESGVKLSDGTYEYAPIGYFTVQTPSGDYDEVSFTAYDRMAKFEKVYNSSLTYPTDSAKVLNEICTMCGVELATPITDPITITENLKGYTCREVLSYIAGIHGFFACIDRFGKLNLRWYSDAPIAKSLKTVWAFEKSQEQYEVEKVEVAKDSETSYTSGNGIITLHHSNPYATQEITNSLYSKLGGYAYMPAEVEMLDDIRLDPWDVISVTYYDGIAYLIPCMSIVHDFGATSTTIRAVGKTSTENEYRFTGPTIQYLNRMATDLLVANRVIATKVDAEYVNAHAITTENFDAKVAEIQKLVVEEIDGKYADIQLANIDIADVGTFFASSGILDDVLIENGAVTGVLKGVRIVGDVIEANTIKADSLILSGSEESLIYQINVNSSGLTAEQLSNEVYKQKLSGTDLVAQSVTANELAANSVTAEKILAKSITAEKLSVASLSALSANLGTVTAGILQSANYVAGRTGVQLDLNNGVWNGKYFNIGSDGKMSATSGKIGNWEITTDGLRYEDGVFSVEISPPTAGTGNIALGFSTYDEGLESYVTEGYVGYNGRGYPYIYMYEYMGNFLDVQQIDATAAHCAKVSAGYDDTGNYELTAANLRCNSWLRSNGNTGWYNQTHGGGVFMQDTTWVRTYGNKGFYCDSTIQGATVTTNAGANLDTLEKFRKYFEFTNRKKLSFMGYAYGNSSTNYGATIRWGSSSIGGYVDDTYWLSMDYTGALRVGVQLNNASQPTWHTK